MTSNRWLRSAEQIMFAAVDGEARVLGVVSPNEGAGVSSLSHLLAESYSRAGSKCILVDLSHAIDPAVDGMGWVPGDGPAQLIRKEESGYNSLTPHPTRRGRQLFNNVETLRQMFKEELADYESIIVDLPPILHERDDLINPLAAARACDSVVMMCVTDHVSKNQIKSAVEILTTAGVNLGGTVMNDMAHPTLGADIARALGRYSRYAPRLTSWLQAKALTSDLLNMRN